MPIPINSWSDIQLCSIFLPFRSYFDCLTGNFTDIRSITLSIADTEILGWYSW